MQMNFHIYFHCSFMFPPVFSSASAGRVTVAMSNMVRRMDGWLRCWVVSRPRRAEEECNARAAPYPSREACGACDYVRS